jgi:hypothetical protein
MGASSNRLVMSDDTSLLWRLVATMRMPRALTVATGEAHPSLVGHHSSDGTTTVGHLTIATEDYGPKVYCTSVPSGFFS